MVTLHIPKFVTHTLQQQMPLGLSQGGGQSRAEGGPLGNTQKQLRNGSESIGCL